MPLNVADQDRHDLSAASRGGFGDGAADGAVAKQTDPDFIAAGFVAADFAAAQSRFTAPYK